MQTEVNTRFGRFIARKRTAKPMKQVELAERAGVSQSYLSALEIGIRRIDLEMAFRICDALEVDIREFLDEEVSNAEEEEQDKTLAI